MAEDVDRWLAERHMEGLWTYGSHAHPPKFGPYLWNGDAILEGLRSAAATIPKATEGRRDVLLMHPALANGTSDTLLVGIQCIMPGEIAESHRHVAGAIRFVIKGTPGAASVVDGEAFPMVDEGDLITTPSLSWHGHNNQGSEPALWLDVLDVVLAGISGKGGSPYPGKGLQPVGKPEGYSSKVRGAAQAPWLKSDLVTPPFRYRWADTYAALETARETESEPDPYDGYSVAYTNPVTGGPTLPTMACALQLLPPKLRTKSHRHNSTTAYYVFRGAGVTTVGDKRLEWSQGDIFVVPPWNWHNHENPASDDAILFAVDDCAAMSALRMYAEEREQ